MITLLKKLVHVHPSCETSTYANRIAAAYPDLDWLLGCCFHQDFDIFCHTLAEIIATYVEDCSEDVVGHTASDIHRFLADYGESDASLVEATERIFKPQVIIEGWEGLTTRQWFLEIARLLEEPRQ